MKNSFIFIGLLMAILLSNRITELEHRNVDLSHMNVERDAQVERLQKRITKLEELYGK